MPLPQQEFDFARGESLTGLSALKFAVDAARYPNATVVNYTFRLWSSSASKFAPLLLLSGSDTVASLEFQIELTAANTATPAVGSYSWEAWDEDNDVKFAEGRCNVRPGRSA